MIEQYHLQKELWMTANRSAILGSIFGVCVLAIGSEPSHHTSGKANNNHVEHRAPITGIKSHITYSRFHETSIASRGLSRPLFVHHLENEDKQLPPDPKTSPGISTKDLLALSSVELEQLKVSYQARFDATMRQHEQKRRELEVFEKQMSTWCANIGRGIVVIKNGLASGIIKITMTALLEATHQRMRTKLESLQEREAWLDKQLVAIEDEQIRRMTGP